LDIGRPYRKSEFLALLHQMMKSKCVEKDSPFIINKVRKHVLRASHHYKQLTLALSTSPNSLSEYLDELGILPFCLDSILADLFLREAGSFRYGTENYDHVHAWGHRMSTEVRNSLRKIEAPVAACACQ
jgi:hypothetical protein